MQREGWRRDPPLLPSPLDPVRMRLASSPLCLLFREMRIRNFRARMSRPFACVKWFEMTRRASPNKHRALCPRRHRLSFGISLRPNVTTVFRERCAQTVSRLFALGRRRCGLEACFFSFFSRAFKWRFVFVPYSLQSLPNDCRREYLHKILPHYNNHGTPASTPGRKKSTK